MAESFYFFFEELLLRTKIGPVSSKTRPSSYGVHLNVLLCSQFPYVNSVSLRCWLLLSLSHTPESDFLYCSQPPQVNSPRN